MNKTISAHKEQQVKTWAAIISDCKEAKEAGISVSEWLKANNISRDTYYYWYSVVKKFYTDSSLPDIVPVKEEIIASSVMQDSNSINNKAGYESPSFPCMKISVNDICIEINSLPDPDLLINVIKAVRYA